MIGVNKPLRRSNFGRTTDTERMIHPGRTIPCIQAEPFQRSRPGGFMHPGRTGRHSVCRGDEVPRISSPKTVPEARRAGRIIADQFAAMSTLQQPLVAVTASLRSRFDLTTTRTPSQRSVWC
jgi:hypothetical protein